MTLIEKVLKILEENENLQLTAIEIAKKIVEKFPEDATKKINDSKAVKIPIKDTQDVVNQLAKEIGARKNEIQRRYPRVQVIEVRPFKYCYDTDYEKSNATNAEKRLERDLYKLVAEYMFNEYGVRCALINDKKSNKANGLGANAWIHPDLVGMQSISENWCKEAKDCFTAFNQEHVKLWSMEVKSEISLSDVRKSYFQAVSNSSWANIGYLVTAKLDARATDELRILSMRHGIGVIILNCDNPSESTVLFPAKRKLDIDWHSVNKLATENPDFRDFVTVVADNHDKPRPRTNWLYNPDEDEGEEL
jgi:uncharacterized protein